MQLYHRAQAPVEDAVASQIQRLASLAPPKSLQSERPQDLQHIPSACIFVGARPALLRALPEPATTACFPAIMPGPMQGELCRSATAAQALTVRSTGKLLALMRNKNIAPGRVRPRSVRSQTSGPPLGDWTRDN